MNCHRCGGLMVRERFINEGDRSGPYMFWGQRCLNCGEMLDPVILENRKISELRSELARRKTYSLVA